MAWLMAGLGPEVEMDEGGVLVLGEQKREPLGEGSFGIVYPCKVRVEKYGGVEVRDAAVKCIWRRKGSEALVENEYRNWKKASGHENVVELYGRKSVKDRVFSALLVCELMKGNLERLIKEETGLNEEEILSTVVQIGKGLQHVHEQGLIHMNLKPTNVLMCRNTCGEIVAKITDFGCSIALEHGEMSVAATCRGTPRYWAPEVVAAIPKSDKIRITQFADIYSYGIIMCDLFNGKQSLSDPKAGNNKVRIHHWGGSDEVSCKASLHVCEIIEQCLQCKDLEDHISGHGRPSAEEVVEKFIEELEEMRKRPHANQQVESTPGAMNNHPAEEDEGQSPSEEEEMGLLDAAMTGDLSRVEDILEASREEVNVQDRDLSTPLLMAAAFNRTEIALVLMEKGANVHHQDAQGYNALMLASVNGNIRVVEALIEAGVDCTKESRNGESALLIAAQTGHEEVCRILKAQGVSLETENVNRRTPLHAAAARGHHEVVKFLLDEGVDPWTIDKKCDGPILSAAGYGHSQAISVIAENARAPDPEVLTDSEPRATTKIGPFVKLVPTVVRRMVDWCWWCCQTTRSEEQGLEEYLIPRDGSSAQQSDPQRNGGEETSSSRTPDLGLDRENNSGSTALQEAAQSGFASTVDVLIKLGADVNKKGTNDMSALHQAAVNGHTEAARVLLNAGAEVDLQVGSSLCTPLFLAVKFGHVDVAKLLRERGANERTNKDGDAAIDAALLHGRTQLLGMQWCESDVLPPRMNLVSWRESWDLGEQVDLERGGQLIYEGEDALHEGAYGVVFPCKLNPPEGGLIDAMVKCEKMGSNNFSEYEVYKTGKVLPHDNLVRFYDGKKLDQGESNYFGALLVFERMDSNLKESVVESRVIAEEFAYEHLVSILEQVVRGLKHLRDIGYIHIDLKPENVLISESYGGNFVVKLQDLGVSRAMRDFGNSATATHRGTEFYMAPEVALAPRFRDTTSRITEHAGVYSFGALMHALLNKQDPPFAPQDPCNNGQEIEVGDVRPRKVLCRGPRELCDLVEECLRFDVSKVHNSRLHGRPTLEEILSALQAMREHEWITQTIQN